MDQVSFAHDETNVKHGTAVDFVAEDLAYIMQSAFIEETEETMENESIDHNNILKGTAESDSSSDSCSDVEITLVKTKTTFEDIIDIDPCSDGEIIDENKDSLVSITRREKVDVSEKECNLHNTTEMTVNTKANEKCLGNGNAPSEESVAKLVLEGVVAGAIKVLRNEKGMENDSSDDSPFEDENQKEILHSILEEEVKVVNEIPRVRNEVLPEELEEEETEEIVLTSKDHLNPIGVISGVVEKMIVVQSNKDAPALDADSAFFLQDRQFIGKVFDTFGPVKVPYYTVRLSSKVDSAKLSVGTKVWFVPFNQEITKYVFVEQLKKMKGSDASWRDDCEPPAEHLDYSDDEEERRAKSEMKQRRQEQAQKNLPDGQTSQTVSPSTSDSFQSARKRNEYHPNTRNQRMQNNFRNGPYTPRTQSNFGKETVTTKRTSPLKTQGYSASNPLLVTDAVAVQAHTRVTPWKGNSVHSINHTSSLGQQGNFQSPLPRSFSPGILPSPICVVNQNHNSTSVYPGTHQMAITTQQRSLEFISPHSQQQFVPQPINRPTIGSISRMSQPQSIGLPTGQRQSTPGMQMHPRGMLPFSNPPPGRPAQPLTLPHPSPARSAQPLTLPHPSPARPAQSLTLPHPPPVRPAQPLTLPHSNAPHFLVLPGNNRLSAPERIIQNNHQSTIVPVSNPLPARPAQPMGFPPAAPRFVVLPGNNVQNPPEVIIQNNQQSFNRYQTPSVVQNRAVFDPKMSASNAGGFYPYPFAPVGNNVIRLSNQPVLNRMNHPERSLNAVQLSGNDFNNINPDGVLKLNGFTFKL